MEIAAGAMAVEEEPWRKTPCQITFEPLNTANHLTPLCTGACGPLQFHTLSVHGAPKALEGGSGSTITSSTWPVASPLPPFALGRRAIHGCVLLPLTSTEISVCWLGGQFRTDMCVAGNGTLHAYAHVNNLSTHNVLTALGDYAWPHGV
jgi:hypothetical protein